MITSSELVATLTIWILATFGVVFGTRAALRRKKARRDESNR